jgi:predicted phage baseplate assembly protein
VIGTSDGRVNQRFPLLHPGIILRPGAVPDVTVDDGPGTDWVLQDTLAFSGPGQAHFTVEVDAQDRATVVFGERPPTPQADVRATYRVGGGEFGNVGADTISTIVPPQELAALPGAAVTNPAPANGGSEREAIEQAVRRAPTLFRAQGRAVTAADYETLALSFAGVGLARALARPGNLVELIVGPEGGGRVLPGMATDLAAYFEDKRPVGTRVMISSIDYVTIYVSVRVFPRPLYDRDQTRRQVEQAVRDVLSFDRAMLGQVVYLSAFYEAVEAVDGVTGATVTQFAKNPDDRTVEPSGRFLLGEDQAARAPVPDTPQGAWTPPELAAGVRVSMVEISL